MKVCEAMIIHRECVGPNDSVAAAQNVMKEGRIPAVPVFDHAQVTGTLGANDVAERMASLGRSPQQLKVRDVMNRDASVARGDEDRAVAEIRMHEHALGSLPVLDRVGKLIGVLPHRLSGRDDKIGRMERSAADQ